MKWEECRSRLRARPSRPQRFWGSEGANTQTARSRVLSGEGKEPTDAEDTFPYVSQYGQSAPEQFDALRRAPSTSNRDDPRDTLLSIAPPEGAWEAYDGLSDYFNEHVRVRSRVLVATTPWERWQAFLKLSLEERSRALAAVDRPCPSCIVDASLWRARRVVDGPECTNFRPSVAMEFYRACHACASPRDRTGSLRLLRVLDPCAGWGDRLLGALASGVVEHVTLVDPNHSLHSGYASMAALEPSVVVQMQACPFERSNLPRGSYDVVFTSPPFFDKETYYAPWSDGQAEARAGPKSRRAWEAAWLRDWYVPFLDKLAACVAPGGVAALYVCDTTSGRLEETTRDRFAEKPSFTPLPDVAVGRGRQLPIIRFRRAPQVPSVRGD
jgi:hypothetical protein